MLRESPRRISTSARNKFSAMHTAGYSGVLVPRLGNEVPEGFPGRVTSDMEFRNSVFRDVMNAVPQNIRRKEVEDRTHKPKRALRPFHPFHLTFQETRLFCLQENYFET